MSYRVEVAKRGQAGCQATHCKKEGVKIAKGELRQGVLVEIMEHQSYRWRHWGCVTPEVLHNWSETCGMDMELVDGYDELPADVQAKVKRALEQKHVDDGDFNGDLEMNRYVAGVKNRGLFVKTPKKKAKDTDDEESEASPTKKKAPKKRGRAVDEEGDAEPAPKKAKGRPKKATKEDEGGADPEEAPKQPAKRGRKAKDSVVDEPEAALAKKPAAKGKKAKSAAKVDSDTIGEEEPAPPKKTKAKKAASATVVSSDDVPAATAAPPQKRKGRGKKAAAAEA